MVVAGSISGGTVSLGDGNDTVRAANIGFGGTQVNIDTGTGNDSVKAGMLGLQIESFAWEQLMQDMVKNAQDSGNEGGNVIAGAGGNDVLVGGAGDDLLVGGGTMTIHIASRAYATNSGLGKAFRFGGVQSQLV